MHGQPQWNWEALVCADHTQSITTHHVSLKSEPLHAGVRSAVYGTMLAVAGVGLAGTLLARSLGIHNAADLQERMQTMWAPVGHHAQQHIVPWRIWLQVLLLSQPLHGLRNATH